MKYTLRKLLIVVTILGVMAATLRMRSPHSVLVMLTCVCGLLSWAAVVSCYAKGMARRVFFTVSISGFVYLLSYIFANTLFESWINDIALSLFASMKSGIAAPIPPADLPKLEGSMEYQYFQQKVHLMLSVVVACVFGWFASS